MDRQEADKIMLGAAQAIKACCADRLACHAGAEEPTECPLHGECGLPINPEHWSLPDIKKED